MIISLLIYLFIYLLIYSIIYLFIYSFIYLFIYLSSHIYLLIILSFINISLGTQMERVDLTLDSKNDRQLYSGPYVTSYEVETLKRIKIVEIQR